MKKLLGIIVLGLLLSGNANSNEMRIECDNISSEKRINNYFFIISSDRKKVTWYKGWEYGSSIVDFSYVNLSLEVIRFAKASSLIQYDFQINRETGRLYSYLREEHSGKCFKMADDFDPKFFVSNTVKKNIAEKKKKNLF